MTRRCSECGRPLDYEPPKPSVVRRRSGATLTPDAYAKLRATDHGGRHPGKNGRRAHANRKKASARRARR